MLSTKVAPKINNSTVFLVCRSGAVSYSTGSLQQVKHTEQALVKKRSLDQVIHQGPGGRSSISGLNATVFGASGFLGRFVTNNLGRIGSQVVVPYRGDSYDVRFLKVMGDLGQINPLFFSLRDYDSIVKMVKDSNVVYNCIGRDYETRNFSFEDVFVEGPRRIAKACRETGVTRLFHVSQLNASENSPSAILRAKAAGEKAVLEEFPDATIVRPAAMYGHGDRFFNRIGFLRRMIPLANVDIIVNNGSQKIMPIAVSNVAEALAKAAKDPNAAGKLYEFVGPKTYTYLEILEHFGEVTRRRISPVDLPLSLAQLMAKFYYYIPNADDISPDTFVQMCIDDKLTPGSLGLESLGVAPHQMETVSLSFLRHLRPAGFVEMPNHF